ncbi:hypothetical protein Dimus_001613, partial [Dionaea muscipula]
LLRVVNKQRVGRRLLIMHMEWKAAAGLLKGLHDPLLMHVDEPLLQATIEEGVGCMSWAAESRCAGSASCCCRWAIGWALHAASCCIKYTPGVAACGPPQA